MQCFGEVFCIKVGKEEETVCANVLILLILAFTLIVLHDWLSF